MAVERVSNPLSWTAVLSPTECFVYNQRFLVYKWYDSNELGSTRLGSHTCRLFIRHSFNHVHMDSWNLFNLIVHSSFFYTNHNITVKKFNGRSILWCHYSIHTEGQQLIHIYMLSLKLLTYKPQITVYMLAQKLQFTCYPQNYNLHVSPELQFTCYHTNYSLYMWPPKLQFTYEPQNYSLHVSIITEI